MTIEEYNTALSIAQDRANRGLILMYIFHLTTGEYYITSQVEYPFVDRSNVERVDEIWPTNTITGGEINWMDL